MIEQRKLTEAEFEQLIKEAPENETRFMRMLPLRPYEFIQKNALESEGIVIDGRPTYFAAIVENDFGRPVLWTVVNSNVKEQFSLYKISKRVLLKWLNKYKFIFATMHKNCEKNLRWTEKLGFKKISENTNTVTLRIGG